MFWDEVQHSVWIGGNSDPGPIHENVPYWLNGIVPLAYQLGDARLIDYVHKYFDYILSHQTEEGWVGPDDVEDGNMYWSKFPLLLALRQVSTVTELVEPPLEITVPPETIGLFAVILPQSNHGFDLWFHLGKTPSNHNENPGLA